MKALLFGLVLYAFSCSAQNDLQPTGGLSTLAPATSISPKLHADTVRLVEVSGARQLLAGSIDKSLARGQAAMADQCPKCTPAFYAEWAKRMKERFPIDQFLAVDVAVYERYLTDEEILRLIDLQSAKAAGKEETPPAALVSRLTAAMPTILSEIAGRCTQIAAKLGADIGIEIQKEHPEYLGLPQSSLPN